MFGCFMIFDKVKTHIYVVYVVKKENMSRGKTVERPSNAVGSPKKSMEKPK